MGQWREIWRRFQHSLDLALWFTIQWVVRTQSWLFREKVLSEAFRSLLQSPFRSSERNEMEPNSAKKKLFYKTAKITKLNDLSIPQNWPNNFQKLILNTLHLIGGRGGGNPVSKQNLERFSFREMLGNKILKVFFYFCSTGRNSELFSLLRNAPE